MIGDNDELKFADDEFKIDDLMNITCSCKDKISFNTDYIGCGNLIAVGGGKDSTVSLNLLQGMDNTCFMINPKVPGIESVEVFDNYINISGEQNIGIYELQEAITSDFNQITNDDNKEEKEQLSILLQEKGGLGDEGSVLSVLSSYSKNNMDADDESESSFPVFPEIIGDDIKSYIEEVDLASKNNKYGVLTTFNMIKPLKKDEDFWIILPFEWEFKKYNGVIRVLLEPIKKSIKKIIINCGNNKKKYIFVLYFKSGEVESIEFSLHPKKDISGFISVLESMVLKKIKYVDFCTLQGFCAKDMDIYVLENSM